MVDFARISAAAHRLLDAKAATYTPAAGGPVSVTVILRRPDEVQPFGDASFRAPAYVADLQLAEVAAPAKGDAIAIDGIGSFKVADVAVDSVAATARLDLEKQ